MEHALFPFPTPDETKSVGSTDITEIEAGLLKIEWKANHAVRDDTLVQKLCNALQDILKDKYLPADAEKYLLASFSPKLQVNEYTGMFKRDWLTNRNEAYVSFPNGRAIRANTDSTDRVGHC